MTTQEYIQCRDIVQFADDKYGPLGFIICIAAVSCLILVIGCGVIMFCFKLAERAEARRKRESHVETLSQVWYKDGVRMELTREVKAWDKDLKAKFDVLVADMKSDGWIWR